MSPGLPTLGPLPPLAETLRRSFVELLGTFALMITAVGHLSGGYFNPAITFGFMLTRRISVLLGLVYVVAQFGGGILAALLLRWIFPAANRDATNLGAPARHVIDLGPALVVEALLTFFLVWVVFATTADPRSTNSAVAGIAIGL